MMSQIFRNFGKVGICTGELEKYKNYPQLQKGKKKEEKTGKNKQKYKNTHNLLFTFESHVIFAREFPRLFVRS